MRAESNLKSGALAGFMAHLISVDRGQLSARPLQAKPTAVNKRLSGLHDRRILGGEIDEIEPLEVPKCFI